MHRCESRRSPPPSGLTHLPTGGERLWTARCAGPGPPRPACVVQPLPRASALLACPGLAGVESRDSRPFPESHGPSPSRSTHNQKPLQFHIKLQTTGDFQAPRPLLVGPRGSLPTAPSPSVELCSPRWPWACHSTQEGPRTRLLVKAPGSSY